MTTHIGSPLINAEQLNALVDDPNTKVFDVRGTWETPARALPDDYEKAHIPGAVFLDWTKEFLQPDLPINLAPVSNLNVATHSFQSLGINKHDLVILYDDYHHMLAGRVWWAMRYWGFNNVKVLNGGWRRWLSRKFSVSSLANSHTKGNFLPTENSALKVSMDEFLRIKESSCILDARGRSGYQGNAEDHRSGHIPGAINIPYSLTMNEKSGLFHDKRTLAAIFDQEIPGWRSRKLISSCGAGYAGTVLMLAFSELGEDIVLFDDSFSVWRQDSSRPVEQGTDINRK